MIVAGAASLSLLDPAYLIYTLLILRMIDVDRAARHLERGVHLREQSNMSKKRASRSGDFDFAIPMESGSNAVTARRAGDVTDLHLCVSPVEVELSIALRHMAKAINLALKYDFIETPLDGIYRASRVRDGKVSILHADYFGLGDGMMASFGKAAKSFALTLKGPDPASPEGKKWIKQHGGGSLGGVLNLMGRKLNLLQEFEDKVPIYVEQLLDRLEAKRIVTDWNRDEWTIETAVVGLDVIMTPKKKKRARRRG